MSEDELTNKLIEWSNSHGWEAYPEVHYNHYGTRGVADLYQVGGISETIYEVKSEAAVRDATGANEIIRQFNKLRENFYRGTEYTADLPVKFELCFTPTEYNLRHLSQNRSMYFSASKSGVSKARTKTNTQICMRSVDEIKPILFFGNSTNHLIDMGYEGDEQHSFIVHAKAANEKFVEKHRDTIDEVLDT